MVTTETEAMTPAKSDRGPRDVMMVDDALARFGGAAITVALAIVFLWFGVLKFQPYEQSGIAGFIMNNPLIAWLHGAFGNDGGARFLGVFEILTGLLIAARFFSARLGLIGGVMGMVTFFITLVCLLTTPGVIQPGYNSPFALSGVPGQFLLKDLVLFAACLWVAATALGALRARRRAV